jgi:hypothetical protein
MTWFETLTGFPEESPQQVRENITVDGQTLTSHANGRVLVYDQLETPTLAELRERVTGSGSDLVSDQHAIFLAILDSMVGPGRYHFLY